MRRFAGGISRLLLVAVLVALGVLAGARSVAAGLTVRVSVDSQGRQAQGGASAGASISADGRFVAFESVATNLVLNDTNFLSDIFLYDLVTGKTTRVSVDSLGRQANGASTGASISADGRYVAFESVATNLVTGDTNGQSDIFVRDLVAGTTTRVSVDSAGRQANGPSFGAAISPDGRYVAFESPATNLVTGDTNGLSDIFVRDLVAGTTVRASVDSANRQANGPSFRAAIAAGGRFVAFESVATNLVTGDTNGQSDIFVRDLMTGKTTRVSVDSVGRQANGPSYGAAISGDGRFVAFESDATNLVVGDTNGKRDIFAYDLVTRATSRVSVDSAGRQANGSSYGAAISSGLIIITTAASSSGSGPFVAFESDASNLVAGDSNLKRDIFVRDLAAGTTVRASVDSAGHQATGSSFGAAISGSGLFVGFESDAINLVPLDSNGKRDVFVHDLR